MRKAVAALGLALAGGLLALGAVEVGLRLTGLGRQFVVPDARIGYRLTPNFARTLQGFGMPSMKLATNDLGLRRDAPTSVVKPAGTQRVLVLGDSQTEGIVENADTYAAVLEQRLGAGGKGRIEVLNAGVSGYSPLLEVLWLREWGLRLAPDVVVLALYTGNDIGELTARETNFAGFGPRLHLATMSGEGGDWTIRRPGAPSAPAQADAWLRAHSRAWELVRSRMRGASPPGEEVVGRVAQSCPGCLQALWQAWLAETQPAKYERALAQLGVVLELAQSAAESIGARLLVVVLPTKLEVEPESVRGVVATASATLGLRQPPELNGREARARMVEACRARGIEVLDLLPELSEARAAAERDFYWAFDWHLDPGGNRAVAEALLEPVSALLPDGPR